MLKYTEATLDDAARLYCWRMDPTVQLNSLSMPPKSFAAHVKWLTEMLDSDEVTLWVVRDTERGQYVGYVRAMREDDTLELSIAVDANNRGRGHARAMLEWITASSSERFRARIKDNNFASLRLFWSLGFRGTESIAGVITMEKATNGAA